jgi:hypothetical protein
VGLPFDPASLPVVPLIAFFASKPVAGDYALLGLGVWSMYGLGFRLRV